MPAAVEPAGIAAEEGGEEKKEKVKTGKVAEKRLKKVLKEVKELGTEIDIDLKEKKKEAK